MSRLAFFIGKRYARGKQRNRFGSAIAAFSLIGMALGVATLIIVLSVMNGFNQEMQARFKRVSPDFTVYPETGLTTEQYQTSKQQIQRDLQAHEGVAAISPGLSSFAMISSDYQLLPVFVKGVAPVLDSQVIALNQHMSFGEYTSLVDGEYGIVIGRYMSRLLRVLPGDKLSLLLPDVRITPMGIYPRRKEFMVVGIFDSDSQLDTELVYIHQQDATRFFTKQSKQSGFRVKLSDLSGLDETTQALRSSTTYAGWRIVPWHEKHQSLFNAMKMEKVTVGALLLIIVMVAAFNIVSGLVMMVSDKRADMSVLKTLGATSSTTMGIFVTQGMILGLLGVCLGAIIGSVIAIYLPDMMQFVEYLMGRQVFDSSVFYVNFLPTQWRLSDFVWIIGFATLLCLFATIIPGWQASKISPKEALNG